MRFRQHFNRDIGLDVIGWRKYGHNEVDEPSFTQPLMYAQIRGRQPSPVDIYEQKLISDQLLSADFRQRTSQRIHSHLESELQASSEWKPSASDFFKGVWAGHHPPLRSERAADFELPTGAAIDKLKQIALTSVTLPPDFTVHPRLQTSFVDARKKMIESGVADWATAEAMAFGSLLSEGYTVRISGEDVERGRIVFMVNSC